jgi:phenylacetate-CoA ligase
MEAFRTHSTFYANRLAGVSAWQDIPPLSKQALRGLPVSAAEPLHETRTSGTTGVQVLIQNNTAERRFRQALAYRPFLFYQLDELDDNRVRQIIFVDGTAIDAVDKQQWPFEFGGRTYLTWRVGIAASPEQILGLLKAVQPQVIRGLTSGIVRFAEEVAARLDGLGVQVVSTSGEQLTPAWRTLLSDAFAAPLLDRYGATETGPIAWQCPYCDDYHANSDELILEESPEGLLATPLFIESQPLLRYPLGDRVELPDAEHDCRIRLPKLRILAGRRDDWLVDGAGRKVSPLSFQFEKVPGLIAWRVHQLQAGDLKLYFDAEHGSSDSELREQLASQLTTIVPGRGYELFAGIWRLEHGGKFKRVVSDFDETLRN